MDIAEITEKMSRGESASDEELKALLTAEGEDRETIFAAARDVRDRVFGNKTYLSGFMYFSTYCRNNCSFCYFRNSNNIDRYRKSTDEVADLAAKIADAGITRLRVLENVSIPAGALSATAPTSMAESDSIASSTGTYRSAPSGPEYQTLGSP